MSNNKPLILAVLAIAILPLIYTAMIGGEGRARSFERMQLRRYGQAKYVPGEVLVKLRPSFAAAAAHSKILSQHNVSIKSIGQSHSRLRINDNRSVESVITALSSDPSVESAQPNYIYRASKVPNDSGYNQDWGLKNAGQLVGSVTTTTNPGTAGSDINAEAAWDVITDCKSVTVAVIDTGINYNHQDLAANIWTGGGAYPKGGKNFITNTNDPFDDNLHGTHVSGTIGAAGNNGVGSVGVCWGASIMALKALDADGSGSTADIISAIQFAETNGAKIVNMSLESDANDPAFEAAIKHAGDTKGILFVIAAGNSTVDNDKTPAYPCSYKLDNIICVAALNQKYGLASFSNFGLKSVHVGAPGTNIYSASNAAYSYLADTFNTGGTINWTNVGGASPNVWAYMKKNLGGTLYDMLTIPNNWDGLNAKYTGNANAITYKTFNLTGADSAYLEFVAFVDISNGDTLKINYNGAGGNPFTAGTEADSITNDEGNVYLFHYSMNNCRTATCSVGFRLQSAAAGTNFGWGMLEYEFTKVNASNTTYAFLQGTSMATPHVAGLAAMVWAQNPKYTYKEVAQNIKSSGKDVTALAGKTTSGKAIDAGAAVRYIIPPQNVVFDQ